MAKRATTLHPDTLIIIEIAEQFLQDHFGHSPDRAEEILSEFFSRFGTSFNEEYVRDEHSWLAHIHADDHPLFCYPWISLERGCSAVVTNRSSDA